MRRFTMAIALTGILSVSTLAGDIPFDYTPPPPPPPNGLQVSPGEIPCDITQQAENAAYAGFLAVVGWLV